jgi:hypothetical protein
VVDAVTRRIAQSQRTRRAPRGSAQSKIWTEQLAALNQCASRRRESRLLIFLFQFFDSYTGICSPVVQGVGTDAFLNDFQTLSFMLVWIYDIYTT